jgi:nicotinamide mononucleotide transporter
METVAVSPSPVRLPAFEWTILVVVFAGMVGLSWFKVWLLPMTEVLGFATGGICVWLVAREHLWNWPIGLANNVFFFVLFFSARLYADMILQVVYFGLGVYGWWNWRYGGVHRQVLVITRTAPVEWMTLAVAIPLCTWGVREILLYCNGAAPFGDSLTTVLSLAAQYLLCRKRLENWFFWIVADIIYIPLYLKRGLPLTAVLYGVFLLMCLLGIKQWWNTWKLSKDQPS